LDCEQKRQHDLLEAFSLLDVEHRQHAHVVLVGDGPDERRLKATVRLLGLDGTVTFAGFQRDPLPWLAAADIFVLASASEGLPGVVIEAMAAMVPCVVTDIPGNNELVYDRHTGLLVPVGQPKKMAEAMQILLRDGEFAAQLADRAFAHVRSKYDIELERKQWSALKSELCERRLERSQ
jgi:glycosyltransferase involved in cell wall biosynthesis